MPANAASARPAATTTDTKGKGRISVAVSGLMDDSPLRGLALGSGPRLHTQVLGRTTSFTVASGGAVNKGTQNGGGGFVIPVGVTKPNRSVPPPDLGHTASVKRSADDALTCDKPAIVRAPEVGENGPDCIWWIGDWP